MKTDYDSYFIIIYKQIKAILKWKEEKKKKRKINRKKLSYERKCSVIKFKKYYKVTNNIST